MITKQEVVEMLACSEGIMRYEQLRTNIGMKSGTAITKEDVLTMVYCINDFNSVIQTILENLDTTTDPTDHSSS